MYLVFFNLFFFAHTLLNLFISNFKMAYVFIGTEKTKNIHNYYLFTNKKCHFSKIYIFRWNFFSFKCDHIYSIACELSFTYLFICSSTIAKLWFMFIYFVSFVFFFCFYLFCYLILFSY